MKGKICLKQLSVEQILVVLYYYYNGESNLMIIQRVVVIYSKYFDMFLELNSL